MSILIQAMVFIFGVATGVNWTFRMIMVEEVAKNYDPEFPAMKLLLGGMMTVETFGGELPFLFLSGESLCLSPGLVGLPSVASFPKRLAIRGLSIKKNCLCVLRTPQPCLESNNH